MQIVLVVDDDEALRRLMHLELDATHDRCIDSGEPDLGLALALRRTQTRRHTAGSANAEVLRL